MRLLRNLNHPNIVKYYQTDLSIQENSIDVLLEYVPGGSLKSILQRYKSLEIEIIRCYAKQLLSGLAYLHENQIVHRDLKPANVLISSEGVVKLTDLGSSRKFTELDNELSKSLKGSPYWMAPEIVTRAGHSFSADIWSFGCVLIEMVNGFPPWYNYSKDTRAVLNMIAKEGALPDFPDTTTELKNIITLCLNRSPNARPTAKDLRSHLFFKQSVLQ